MTARGPGAYVHVPFCAHRCTYCSFTALTGLGGEGEYFRALETEIRRRAGEVEGPFDTLYFGGGTPSFAEPRRLAAVRAALSETFGVSDAAEVTAEGNPDDLDDRRLEALAGVGVNRLSVGVQSLEDGELAFLERRHDAAAGVAAIRRAVRVFGNVSGDLMIGVPGQTRESLRRSVTGILEAGVSHLSVYILELEKAPKLRELKRERPNLFPPDDEIADRWEEVDDLARTAGLPRYETSNWAREGRESRHNLKYWDGSPTLGFGVSAVSFDGRERRANTDAFSDYLRRLERGESAVAARTPLSEDEAVRERVLLGLRLAAGVPLALWERALATLAAPDRDRLRDAADANLLETDAGRVRLTRAGVLLSNEVFAAFV